MKKIVALTLCLVLVLGLMSGCEKAMDARTLLQKMEEVTKEQTSVSAKMNMEMDMSMAMTGITMNLGLNMDADMAADVEAGKLYSELTMVMEMLGQTEEQSMTMYATNEDGVMTSYTHEDLTDTWVKLTQEQDMTSQYEELLLVQMDLSDIPDESLTLAKQKENIDGTVCYVLTVELDGSAFEDTMKAGMEVGMGELDEETKAIFENIDWSALTMKMVYYVDTKTYAPVKMIGDILGMGDVMNSMIAPTMGDMMGAGDMEIAIDVPVCKITMTDLVYGDVQVPDVPQEAIDNAIDGNAVLEDDYLDDELLIDDSLIANPAQPDGSYLLSGGDISIRVTIPEGLIVMESEADSLYATDEAYMNIVGYGLITDQTVEEMQGSFQEEIDWAIEEDYYKSHTDVAELDGYRYMSLIYNDNTSAWIVWKELDGAIFALAAEVEGETCDLAALLAAVEFI